MWVWVGVGVCVCVRVSACPRVPWGGLRMEDVAWRWGGEPLCAGPARATRSISKGKEAHTVPEYQSAPSPIRAGPLPEDRRPGRLFERNLKHQPQQETAVAASIVMVGLRYHRSSNHRKLPQALQGRGATARFQVRPSRSSRACPREERGRFLWGSG